MQPNEITTIDKRGLERLMYYLIGNISHPAQHQANWVITAYTEQNIITAINNKDTDKSLILSQKEREILTLRHGLIDGVPHTLREIAKTFGKSPGRIRQLEAKAHEKIRQIITIKYINKD